jgi:superfamily II DNA/RNA helicase
MTEIQQKTAQLLLDGEDMIGVAKTGSGKTLAYALPILLKLAQEPK